MFSHFFLRAVAACALLFAALPCTELCAQVMNQIVRLDIANRRLEGTTYMADIWVMIMADEEWNVCDSRMGFTFNRNALNASAFDYQPLPNLDPELQNAGYTALQYYYPNTRVLSIELMGPLNGYVLKAGGSYGSSFRLGTVRWQATNLAGMDQLKYAITETWLSWYNPGRNACFAFPDLNVSHSGIIPLYIQPTGCMPMYFDQPANCNDPLREYETTTPLSRICPHWPPVAGPGVQPHRVYYQYDFARSRMPSVARTRAFNGNDVPAVFDRARCRWEAQIDQLTPPVTNVFEWVETSAGGRMYFTTNYTTINTDEITATHTFGLTKWARHPNAQWQIVDSAACGTANRFFNRSEIVFNNSSQMYLYHPHLKWTTDLANCGDGPDCLDLYNLALHELGHYIGLAHQPRNHHHLMYGNMDGGGMIYPLLTELTQCDADNVRRLYNPSRIGYPVDNSFDCSTFTGVPEHAQHQTERLRVVSDADEHLAVYFIPTAGSVELDICNAMGQTVATVFHGIQAAGEHVVRLPVHSLASGVYFVRMQTGAGVQSRRLLVVK